MHFINIGTGELLLILILAFIVLGPGRITKLGRDIGVAVRKLNRNQTFRDVVSTTEEIRNYPRKIMQDAMLDEPLSLDSKPHDQAVAAQEKTQPPHQTNS